MDCRTKLLKRFNTARGFLLSEILIAIAIIAVLLSFSFRITNLAARSTTIIMLETQANALTNEFVEMTRSRRNEGWDTMYLEDDTGGFLPDGTEDPEYVPNPQPIQYGQPYHFSYHEPSGNLFLKADSVISDEYGEEIGTGKFSRYIEIYQVRRDPTDNSISNDAGDPIDNESLRVVAKTEWVYQNKTRTIEKEFYLTNWYGF